MGAVKNQALSMTAEDVKEFCEAYNLTKKDSSRQIKSKSVEDTVAQAKGLGNTDYSQSGLREGDIVYFPTEEDFERCLAPFAKRVRLIVTLWRGNKARRILFNPDWLVFNQPKDKERTSYIHHEGAPAEDARAEEVSIYDALHVMCGRAVEVGKPKKAKYYGIDFNKISDSERSQYESDGWADAPRGLIDCVIFNYSYVTIEE